MVIEKVELTLLAGREEEALAFVAANRGAMERSAGFRSLLFGRGVEDPSKLFILVGWETVEAHYAAREQPGYQPFRNGLRAFISGAAMEHFVAAPPS